MNTTRVITAFDFPVISPYFLTNSISDCNSNMYIQNILMIHVLGRVKEQVKLLCIEQE